MYILQEIPRPQSRTVDLTVRNNLSISWANDRKYPYSNPGTHPHVGPTSGDHPVSYMLRSRLSPTQQARQVRSFSDIRFRSDDDHFLDLPLLLRESNEIERHGRRPRRLDRGYSPAASLPGHGNGSYSFPKSGRTSSPPFPPRLALRTGRGWRSPASQTTTPNALRAGLRAPATIGDPSAPPSASRDAPRRPAHVRLPWRTCARRRAAQPANPSRKPTQQLAYEHH
nr:unnamed protein product [Digitaria exilis]